MEIVLEKSFDPMVFFFGTDAEIEAYCNEFLESGKWCLSEKVTVNGIEYDMFCFPMHSGDYTPEM